MTEEGSDGDPIKYLLCALSSFLLILTSWFPVLRFAIILLLKVLRRSMCTTEYTDLENSLITQLDEILRVSARFLRSRHRTFSASQKPALCHFAIYNPRQRNYM